MVANGTAWLRCCEFTGQDQSWPAHLTRSREVCKCPISVVCHTFKGVYLTSYPNNTRNPCIPFPFISIFHFLMFTLSQLQVNSACHPSGVSKWGPAASAGKENARMVQSVRGRTRDVPVKLWDPVWLERVPYLSALEVCSRRGTIQIHVYLTLPHLTLYFEMYF